MREAFVVVEEGVDVQHGFVAGSRSEAVVVGVSCSFDHDGAGGLMAPGCAVAGVVGWFRFEGLPSLLVEVLFEDDHGLKKPKIGFDRGPGGKDFLDGEAPACCVGESSGALLELPVQLALGKK